MLSKPPASKEQSRAASAGLAVSLVALLMGTFAGRRRLLANAVKFMAMVCLIVSLGVLVGACGTSGNENFLGDNSGTISPSTTVVQSTITATPPSGTPQSVTIYNTYTNGSI
jgi:hypothetical protein